MEEKRPAQQPYEQRKAPPPAPGEADGVQDDSRLLIRSAKGDIDAQHALIERHGRYLYGIAMGMTGNAPDAEDLVQETFMGAFTSRFRGESALRTWLVQILVRRTAMLRRTRNRWVSGRGPGVLSIYATGKTARGEAETQEPVDVSSAAGGAGADARLDLATMLECLSPEHRAVIVLRELQHMSYEQMAEALGVPRGTVESRLHRARDELRKRFKGY